MSLSLEIVQSLWDVQMFTRLRFAIRIEQFWFDHCLRVSKIEPDIIHTG